MLIFFRVDLMRANEKFSSKLPKKFHVGRAYENISGKFLVEFHHALGGSQ